MWTAKKVRNSSPVFQYATTRSTVEENRKDILQRHREKLEQGEIDAGGSSLSPPSTQDKTELEDVDHALGASLRALSVRSRGQSNYDGHSDAESRVIQIEWNEELEEMRREKAEAEARNGEFPVYVKRQLLKENPAQDLKQRFKSHTAGATHSRKKTPGRFLHSLQGCWKCILSKL
jgi:predicted metal-dependent peptidase